MLIICWIFNLVAVVAYVLGIVFTVTAPDFSFFNLLIVLAILSLIDYLILSVISYIALGESVYAGIFDMESGCLGFVISIVMSILTSPIMVLICLFLHFKITLQVADEC